MILFSQHITPRLSYVVDFVSTELFDEPAGITITTDQPAFAAAPGPRINYSAQDIPGCFRLQPTSLLFESDVHPITIQCFPSKDQKAFFPTQGDFPFDIFAAIFYLLSRYEEYLPHPLDEYGRFAHTHSLAFREGFLHQPLINSWLQEFKNALSRHYPDLAFRHPVFKFVPTYDIDSAYAYLHKGWRRNLGGLLKGLLSGRWQQVKERISVVGGRLQDPFDIYEWLDSLHLYCRTRPYYFFLAAARCKGVDRNTPTSGPGLQELIQYYSALTAAGAALTAAGAALTGTGATVTTTTSRLGVHPSWQSGDQEMLLKEELEWMEYISGQKIIRSRQHYIRFTLPATYRRLLKYGIEQDFSMGYGSVNGFRASVASSFYWYDLEKEEQTTLRLFPFCFMDANSFYEQHFSAAQAMTELMHYYRSIRKINGLMVTIWHNSILGRSAEFTGWREVYEVFLKEEVFWDM
jgi:hypothetical protein